MYPKSVVAVPSKLEESDSSDSSSESEDDLLDIEDPSQPFP